MKRIQFVDSLKGFAIICVVWGHSIQHFRNGHDAFTNPMFEIIYSFHMPLFFLISGMFFKSSLKYNFRKFFKKKAGQLLLPCFVWAVIFLGFRVGFCYFNASCTIDRMVEIKNLIIPFKWPFWFLKQLFFSYSLTYLFYKIFKTEWLIFLLLLSFVAVFPAGERQRFLLPLFLAGIVIKDNYQFVLEHLKKLLFGSALLFVVCLIFWKGSYTIYVTEFPPIIDLKNRMFDFRNMDISLFRLVIGLSGSVFFLLLFQKIYKQNRLHALLTTIGTYTLTIYILQFSLVEINPFPDFQVENNWIYNLLITPLVSVVVLLICFGVIFFISQLKSVGKILFGNSFRENHLLKKDPNLML